MTKNLGLIQIYTGDGKGKTTAAAGLAVRAAGQGLKACFIYFFKDPKKWGCGEFKILKKIGVTVKCVAGKHPYFCKNISKDILRTQCLNALDFIRKKIFPKKYDVIILDEILIAVRGNFLTEAELLSLLRGKPVKTELVLTGRGATKALIKYANLVSEIKKIKHPYDSGIRARRGIEF